MASATTTSLGTVKLAGDLSGSNNPLAPELPVSGVIAGTATNPNITVNAKGLITSLSNGSAVDVFNVPFASASQAGVVKIGSGLQVDATGLVSIPIATATTAGVAQVGSGLTVSSGVMALDTTLYPTIANGYTYSGAIITAISTQNPVGGVLTLDLSKSNAFTTTLTANTTFNLPTNIIAGGAFFIVIRQDATGGRTAVFNSAFKFESGSTGTLSTEPNAVDLLRIVVASPTELLCRLYKNFV